MKKVLLLTLGMFALGFDAYVVAGLLPAMRETFHISDAQAGQIVSVFTLCYALAAPLFAALFAGKSLRRLLVTALVIFTLANGASALAPSYGLLLAARAVAGAGAGLFSPLATVAAAGLVPRHKQGRALGLTLGGMSIGTVIGVPLGLAVAGYAGWEGALWIVTLIGAAAACGIYFLFPDLPAAPPPALRERVAMMTNKRVLAIIGITFVAAVASLGLYTYFASVLLALTGVLDMTPYLWAWGLGGVIGSFTIGTLIDRTGRPALLLTGLLAILAAALSGMPAAASLSAPAVPMLFAVFLWGAAGWASLAPQQHALLAAQPEHPEAVVALQSSANYLGSSAGSMAGGLILFMGLNPSRLPLVMGLLAAAALTGQIILMVHTARVHRHK